MRVQQEENYQASINYGSGFGVQLEILESLAFLPTQTVMICDVHASYIM